MLRERPYSGARFRTTYHQDAERKTAILTGPIGACSAQLLPGIYGLSAGAVLFLQGGNVNVTNVLKPALGYLCYAQLPGDHCCY
jgi:hypothetical protein